MPSDSPSPPPPGGELAQFFVIVDEHDPEAGRLRGPYQHAETASAVRHEMEQRWPDKSWNLQITAASRAPAGGGADGR